MIIPDKNIVLCGKRSIHLRLPTSWNKLRQVKLRDRTLKFYNLRTEVNVTSRSWNPLLELTHVKSLKPKLEQRVNRNEWRIKRLNQAARLTSVPIPSWRERRLYQVCPVIAAASRFPSSYPVKICGRSHVQGLKHARARSMTRAGSARFLTRPPAEPNSPHALRRQIREKRAFVRNAATRYRWCNGIRFPATGYAPRTIRLSLSPMIKGMFDRGSQRRIGKIWKFAIDGVYQASGDYGWRWLKEFRERIFDPQLVQWSINTEIQESRHFLCTHRVCNT